MKQFRYETMAARNDPMPKGLNSAEQMLYQGLAYLHARYRRMEIDGASAAAEKMELYRAYEKAAYSLQLFDSTSQMWERLAGPAAEFRKTQSVDAAWKMHEVIYKIGKGTQEWPT